MFYLDGKAYCHESEYEELITSDPSLKDLLTALNDMEYSLALAFSKISCAGKRTTEIFEELAEQAYKEPERMFHCRICGRPYMFRKEAKECEREHRRLNRGK